MKKEVQTVLKMRAAEMAKEPGQKKAASALLELVSFTLGPETYGIESSFIREVYPLKDFSPLPGIPPYVLGIINIRGQILAVVNLKKFFNLPEKGIGELNKVIILRDEQMEFGILADTIQGEETIEVEDIKAVPEAVSEIGSEYVKGVTSRNLIVLNAEKILADKSIIVNDKII